MDEQTVTDTLHRFITETFMVDFAKDADADTDLFEAKFLDSFGFVDLVAFLEQTYSIRLSEDDLSAPEMGSLNGMRSLVMKRLTDSAVSR
jgi:acyl carrier protein